MKSSIHSLALFMLLALVSFGQNQEGSEGAPAHIQEALVAWQADNGKWSYTLDKETGYVRELFGGVLTGGKQQDTPEGWGASALRFVELTESLTGVRAGSLRVAAVRKLLVATHESTEKVSVRLTQWLGQVKVRNVAVNVILEESGSLLAIQTDAVPLLSSEETPAVGVSSEMAVRSALKYVDSLPGLLEKWGDPVLIASRRPGRCSSSQLAYWSVMFAGQGEDGSPSRWEVLVDAVVGQVVEAIDQVHRCGTGGASGIVVGYATPGTGPPMGDESLQSLPDINILADEDPALGWEDATADSAGQFFMVNEFGYGPPVDVLVELQGPFASVSSYTTSNHSIRQTLSASAGNVIALNASRSPSVTTQVNAYLWITNLRNWVRNTNPGDDTADFTAAAVVNRTDGSCNAYYDGVSVNFYAASSGCSDSAYSSIVLHEMGHWLNDRYGSGNSKSGFGEGNADVFAMYALDEPIVGRDFYGPGANIRSALHNEQKCPDNQLGCLGASEHTNGLPLMGALWNVRERLKEELGVSVGGDTANALFNGWMVAWDDQEILDEIRDHWLLVDDDDGDISNGTPHGQQIDRGFRDHGWPGMYPLVDVFVDVDETQLPFLGTPGRPYNSISRALALIDDGGEVHVASGEYPEAQIIAKPVTISSTGGSVVIR